MNNKIVTIGIVVTLVIVVFFLAGCKPEETMDVAHSSEPTATETVEAIEPTATSTDASATEPPVATQTQASTPTQASLIEDPVLNDVNERWQAYKQASQLLNQLIQFMADDPNVMVDEGWKREVGFVLNVLDSAALDLTNLSDLPPEYVQLEENLHAVAMETYLFIDNFSYAIANLDADAMGESTQNVRTIAEFSRLVDDELDSFLAE